MGEVSRRKAEGRQTRAVNAENYTMQMLVMANNAVQFRRMEMVSIFGLAALGNEVKARLERDGRVDVERVMQELAWLTTGIANGQITKDPMPEGPIPTGPILVQVPEEDGDGISVDNAQDQPYNERAAGSMDGETTMEPASQPIEEEIT